MCGRYTIAVESNLLASRFDAVTPEAVTPRFNAAPTQDLPTILNDDQHHIKMLHWGFIPHWAKDASVGNRMINARAETLEEKPFYRDALKKHRCLVLADGFYEWQTIAGKKTPMRIALKSGEPFAFAGLWSTWKDENGNWLPTFTIITTTPNDVVSPIHNRMPAILLPENEKIWLDDDAGPERWKTMLRPYPSEMMLAYPVSKRVNSVKNDDPSLVTPVEDAAEK